MNKLFFVLFICTFAFPVTGMEVTGNTNEAQALAPGTPLPPPVIPVPAPHIHAAALSNLLEMSIEQIRNIHRIFSGEYTKENQPKIMTAPIKKRLSTLLENVFVPYFKTPRNKRFTPDCKKSLGTHLKDIDSNSPGTFLKKGSADFLQSVDPDTFYTIDTHEQNTFFIQKMLIDPAYGFSLFRNQTAAIKHDPVTNTLKNAIAYGRYNVVKLLEAVNPETHSGAVELHHVYQNPEVITIVPYSEHKGYTTRYHKSKKDSKIDRASAASEFYFLKKLMGLLQVARMCSRVLHDCNGLSSTVLGYMTYIDNYVGSSIIPNPKAVLPKRKQYTVEEAFAQHNHYLGALDAIQEEELDDNSTDEYMAYSDQDRISEDDEDYDAYDHMINAIALPSHEANRSFTSSSNSRNSSSSSGSNRSSISGRTTDEDNSSDENMMQEYKADKRDKSKRLSYSLERSDYPSRKKTKRVMTSTSISTRDKENADDNNANNARVWPATNFSEEHKPLLSTKKLTRNGSNKSVTAEQEKPTL